MSPFLFVVTQKRPHNFLVMRFVLISVHSKNFYKKISPRFGLIIIFLMNRKEVQLHCCSKLQERHFAILLCQESL